MIEELPKESKSTLKTFPFEKWRQMGYDENSMLADPLFIDPVHDDYRLRPESPALTLGFKPIDVTKIGIRKEPHRR